MDKFLTLDAEDEKLLKDPGFKKAWIKFKAYWILRDSGENLPYPPPPDPRFTTFWKSKTKKQKIYKDPVFTFVAGYIVGIFATLSICLFYIH